MIFSTIDNFLNYITMYRLVLYSLIFLLVIAMIEGAFHIIPFSPIAILTSSIFLVGACWITNKIFSNLLHAPTNFESVYISSLILACVTGPASSIQSFIFLGAAAFLTIASKYIFAISKKHIFNPVGFGILSLGLLFHHYATWWVGSFFMTPFVIICGILITKKLRRTHMLSSFFISASIFTLIFSIVDKSNVPSSLFTLFLNTPIFFFAFIMFTEPLTTPPTKLLRVLYGIIVGVLFSPQFHIGSFHLSLELALLIGNIFSYLVSSKSKLFLHLKEKAEIAPHIFNFTFDRPKNFSFTPGQYMEWTLPHPQVDSRGNRRYFTIASSPTEDTMMVGVRIDDQRSSFKNTLNNLSPSKIITASQLAGDFTLPKDTKEKLVFIAGGIGITPFRSMLKYLIDGKEKRDIVLFYTVKDPTDFAYKELFDKAQKQLETKIIYKAGRIDAEMIKQEIPDYKKRTFYLSGPNAMVRAYEKALKSIGVFNDKIKIDYFPGYA